MVVVRSYGPQGERKIGYITGDQKTPYKEGAGYDAWDAENWSWHG